MYVHCTSTYIVSQPHSEQADRVYNQRERVCVPNYLQHENPLGSEQ